MRFEPLAVRFGCVVKVRSCPPALGRPSPAFECVAGLQHGFFRLNAASVDVAAPLHAGDFRRHGLRPPSLFVLRLVAGALCLGVVASAAHASARACVFAFFRLAAIARLGFRPRRAQDFERRVGRVGDPRKMRRCCALLLEQLDE